MSILNFKYFFFSVIDVIYVSFDSALYDSPRQGQLIFQRPATQTMEQLTDLHHDIFSLLLFLCIVVFYLLVQLVYKFRATNFQTPSNFFFKAHTVLEIFWTIMPMFIVLFILYPSFALLYAMDELKDPLLTVKIMGHQWYWTYEMPISYKNTEMQRVVTFDSYMLAEEDLPFGGFSLLEVDNRLRLPMRTVMRLLITSTDVLHSWAVPSFGVKVDACPGRLNQASVLLERLGIFFGQCSEICGINHGFMPITVESLLIEDFLKKMK